MRTEVTDQSACYDRAAVQLRRRRLAPAGRRSCTTAAGPL